MSSIRDRIPRFVRAHPRRSGVVVAVAVLLLIVAMVAGLPREGIESGKAPGRDGGQDGRSGDTPVSRDLPGTDAGPDGSEGSGTGEGAGGATDSTASPGRDSGPGGASTSPTGGGRGVEPGTTAPDGGMATELRPVEPRTPVRCAPSGAPSAGALPSVDEREGRRWVTVGRLTGNCDAASDTFPLQGIDTRLVWRSDADSLAIFVVDVVQGREASAGFADGQCAGTCSERQAIVPTAGSYRLEVQAGAGPWEVEIQEYRRP